MSEQSIGVVSKHRGVGIGAYLLNLIREKTASRSIKNKNKISKANINCLLNFGNWTANLQNVIWGFFCFLIAITNCGIGVPKIDVCSQLSYYIWKKKKSNQIATNVRHFCSTQVHIICYEASKAPGRLLAPTTCTTVSIFYS